MNFVTGSSGFVASHLLERIGGDGYDNYSVPNAINNGAEKRDILDFPKLSQAMKWHDMVWHLAASSDIAVGNKITNTDLQNNTVGTYNVLEAMRLNKIYKLVFSSSATYYGNRVDECIESMSPMPTSLYGASKVAGEALISAYSNLFDIRAWVFRFGNVVGGRMGHGILYDLIKKLRENPKELKIIGDGKQIRPFFLVEDCIDGMLCAVRYPPSIYNLAPTTVSVVDEVVQIVIEEMGLMDVKITHLPKPVYDVPIVKINTDKIQTLGWKPKHTSDEAVRIATRRLLKDNL
jgi:UDP-glucose 4-epimerase